MSTAVNTFKELVLSLSTGAHNTPEFRGKLLSLTHAFAILASETFIVRCDDSNNPIETQNKHELHVTLILDNKNESFKVGPNDGINKVHTI